MATVIFHGACGRITGSCIELAWNGRMLPVFHATCQSGKFCLENCESALHRQVHEVLASW